MTPVRWILACALALGLGGLARAAQSAPPSAAPTCPACKTAAAPASQSATSSCPACCQDCPTASSAKASGSSPCCSVWSVVLRLGGVGVGDSVAPRTSTGPAASCAACTSAASKAKAPCCCEGEIYEVVGQCAPVCVEEACETHAGCCGTACSTCPQAKPAAACPCPAGACATVCVPGCPAGCSNEGNFVIFRGVAPPRTPPQISVSPIQVSGNHVIVSRRVEGPGGQLIAINSQASVSPLQISVKGKQVFIRTATMQATCDRITSLPTGPFQVMMEGNVQVRYNAPHAPTRIEAKRILVDLRSDEFKVASDDIPAGPANRVGLWYAPSPVPMLFPPAPPMPPMPPIAYPVPMPRPIPVAKPVSRPVAPTVYYQPMPSAPNR
jgi:hypothetical protein